MQALDLGPVIPALILGLAGLAAMLVQAFAPKDRQADGAAAARVVAIVGLASAMAALLAFAPAAVCPDCRQSTGGSVVLDPFALLLSTVLLAIGLLVVMLSPSYLRATGRERGEYYALLLFSLVGMLGLVSTVELISMFVALEIMSISLYAMAGSDRTHLASQESALKYFITGSFSSTFLLYGVALLYGISGSTILSRIGAATGSLPAPMLALLGLAFLLVGFAFKVAAVPFHAWAPDVYEGAPTTVTALMAAGVKAAAFGALLRVLAEALPALGAHWRPVFAVLALVTMLLGNLGALAQRSVKRMLAYSSIAHAGYLLSALVATQETATEAVLFYLVAYAAANVGGFGTIAALARDGREPVTLSDFAGLAQRRPALAAAVSVFLISLTGIPISAGFIGKFHLFSAAVSGGYVLLAVVGVLVSVISAYYYLRVVVAMYMQEPPAEDPWGRVSIGSAIALTTSALVVVALGVYPAPLLDLARLAARAL